MEVGRERYMDLAEVTEGDLKFIFFLRWLMVMN